MFSVIKCNCLINTGAENLNCLSIYKSEAVLYVYQACRTGNYFKSTYLCTQNPGKNLCLL